MDNLDRARDHFISKGVDPIWLDTTSDGVLILHETAALLLSVQEEAWEYAKNNICQFYPHMCRDDHQEIGFRGDHELCPVDKKLAERDAEVKRVVKEAQDRFNKIWKAMAGETHDLNKGASIACDEIKRRLEAKDSEAEGE